MNVEREARQYEIITTYRIVIIIIIIIIIIGNIHEITR